MKPLLVGECNPHGADPRFALWPDPPGCAGHRLCHRVMGLEPDDYLARFDRANLCKRKWSLVEARRSATALWCGREDGSVLVLLGAKVSSAFGYEEFRPFTVNSHSWLEFDDLRRGRVVVLPHPSGLSRAWNALGAFERARATLREAGAL